MKIRYVLLTDYNISIAEFKTTKQLNNYITQKGRKDIRKILTGKAIKTATYLPFF
jgi:ribosomal protein S18